VPAQFVVPQFIDVEDKIIGPITTRQFIIGVIAAALVFVSYKLSDLTLFIIQTLFIVGIYALIGFVKINGRPFYYFTISVLQLLLRPGLRVWMKKDQPIKVKAKDKSKKDEAEEQFVPQKKKPFQHSLSQVSLLVDTGGKYRPEEILEKQKSAKKKKPA
jgi:hypothetical protein|tara:strand:- start:4448 stop:4924 length:477 start_codon:yes stop_codon:yes gene_type:complete